MRRGPTLTVAAIAVAVALGGAYAVLARGGDPPAARPAPAPTTPAPTTTAAATTAPATTARPGCTETPGEPAQGPAPAAGDAQSRIKLGPSAELRGSAKADAAARRGQRLVVSGTVYAADCTTPLAGATLQVWQTDADGVYGPGHGTANITCCYLQGTLRTDARGRYEITTIKPGRYQGQTDPPPAHIHFDVRHPDAGGLMTELLFEGDPDVIPGTQQGHVARLTTVAGSDPPLLRARFDIVLPRRS
jgi:protocatechuate 3,4-dioxygenase beta subunit